MKRLVALFFSVFYFACSSGVVFSVHQCMDEILISKNTDGASCNVCDRNDKNDCCKTEVKFLKSDVFHKADLMMLSLVKHFSEVSNLYSVFQNTSFPKTETPSVLINAPPEIYGVPVFIRHCNFRI